VKVDESGAVNSLMAGFSVANVRPVELNSRGWIGWMIVWL
jgi:hypothetical protein